jgi:hypothetical protein
MSVSDRGKRGDAATETDLRGVWVVTAQREDTAMAGAIRARLMLFALAGLLGGCTATYGGYYYGGYYDDVVPWYDYGYYGPAYNYRGHARYYGPSVLFFERDHYYYYDRYGKRHRYRTKPPRRGTYRYADPRPYRYRAPDRYRPGAPIYRDRDRDRPGFGPGTSRPERRALRRRAEETPRARELPDVQRRGRYRAEAERERRARNRREALRREEREEELRRRSYRYWPNPGTTPGEHPAIRQRVDRQIGGN